MVSFNANANAMPTGERYTPTGMFYSENERKMSDGWQGKIKCCNYTATLTD
jgi:hypothetical protein